MHPFTLKKLAKVAWPFYSPRVEACNRNAQMLKSLHALHGVSAYRTREDLYCALNERLGGEQITYLEFGVWKGESIKAWTSINKHPKSRFFGFDSFEGLPEDWRHGFGTATTRDVFNVNGNIPISSDDRVRFVKGWFQHTLSSFLSTTELTHPLVINNDSDLHSSTLYTLATLSPLIRPGDIIVFDEYISPLNEYLAWAEFQCAFMRQAKCIGMSNRWMQVAFEFTN